MYIIGNQSPYPSLGFLLLLVQLVDVGQSTAVIMAPEHRVAVVPSTHDAVLSQPQAGEVGEVTMRVGGDSGVRKDMTHH